MLTREGRRRQVRFRKKTVLYAAGVLACGNIALQALGFVYRVMLSRFAGAEGLGMYRLANSVYLVLHTGCLSGVTMACSRLSAACEATGEKGKTGAVLRLAFSVFLRLRSQARQGCCCAATRFQQAFSAIRMRHRRFRSCCSALC